MTKDELVERAKRQLNAGQPEPRVWPDAEIDIDAAIMVASNKLADEVMYDPYERALLQQTYSITLDGSGQGDLLSATGSITGLTGEILQDGIRSGNVLDFDGNQLQPLLHYADFLKPQPTVYAYYTIKDRDKILTRRIGQQVNGVADIQGVNGPLTIVASYAPDNVSSWPSELEDRLVQALVDTVAQKITPANA